MKIKLEYYNPILVVGYKGFPINKFVAQVYTSRGNVFDYFFICHETNIHQAYAKGFEKLKEAYEAEGHPIDEYYSKTLNDYVYRHPDGVEVSKRPEGYNELNYPNNENGY